MHIPEVKAMDDYDYVIIPAKDLKAIYRLAYTLRASERPMTLDEKLDWGNRLHLVVAAAEPLPPD